MSYILDALQRAALERERASGTVPGLQTRSIAATTATQKGGAAVRDRWYLLALMIVLTILAISFILWPRSPESTPVALSPLDSRSAASAIAPTPVAVPAVVSPTAAPEPSSLNPPSPSLPTSPDTVRAAPQKMQSTAPPAVSVTMPTDAPQSVPVSVPARTSPPPQRSASALQTSKAILPFLKDLPDALRNQLPPLSISGVVYSDNPAQRLLLINGQVLPQGSRAAEDVVLDEIHQRSSDFTFKGTRFKLSH
jgi:general secretion pathway protein B